MKPTVLSIIFLFFISSHIVCAETIHEIGPRTVVDTRNIPSNPNPIIVVGNAMRLDTRNAPSNPLELIGPRFVVDTRNNILKFTLSQNKTFENKPKNSVLGIFEVSGMTPIRYELLPRGQTNDHQFFSVTTGGILTNKEVLDFEKRSVYEITVKAVGHTQSYATDFLLYILDDKTEDSDGDGYTDEEEIAAGTDPFDPNSKPGESYVLTIDHTTIRENLSVDTKIGKVSVDGVTQVVQYSEVKGLNKGEIRIDENGTLFTSIILQNNQTPEVKIRIRAEFQDKSLRKQILEKTFVIEVLKMSPPPPPPPPPPPMNDWKERWEKEKKELVNINNRIEDQNATLGKLEDQIIGVQDQIEGVGKENIRLDTEISKTEAELKQVLARIAELGVKYTDAQKHSEKIILQKSNAEKEVVRLSQEYDHLDKKVKEKREEANTLVAKLKVPFLKGWHYTADKGWLWTDLDYYPIVYSNAEDAWIHYDQGTSDPWHYYNYSTQEWFEWE